MEAQIISSPCCGETISTMMEIECEDCGKATTSEEMEMALVANDVVALYPSLKSENTGKIIRKKVQESKVIFEGFDDKMGRAYIVLNRKYTSDLEKIEHILPKRASNKGKAPSMAGLGPRWDPETQWIFPAGNISAQERKIVISHVIEIALRALWENFTYKFAGKNYHQTDGGPIGVRVSGAASEVVMQDWSETYHKILVDSGLWVALLGGYVDDGRHISTVSYTHLTLPTILLV